MLDFSGHHNNIHTAFPYLMDPEGFTNFPLCLISVYRSGKIFFCHNNAQPRLFQMIIRKENFEILI